MPPRVSRAVLLSAILLFPIGRAPADTIIERVYVPTTSVVEVPTYTTTSATVYVPRTYTTTSTVLRPTTYTLSPTAYIVPTSSVVRTSYVVPTRYIVPTSYVAPTTYVTRRYVPTVSLIPTSVSTLLRTSAEVPLCCDSAPVVTTVAADPCETGTRTVIEAPLSDGATRGESVPADEPIDPPSTPNGALRSGPSDPVVNPDADSTRTGEAPGLDPKTLQSTPRSQPANPPTPPAAPAASELDIPAPLSDVPPPSTPVVEPNTPEVPLADEPPAPAPAAVPATPPHDPAPPLSTPAGTPGGAATADHSAMRPALSRNAGETPSPRTGVGTGTRSMLQGRVVSAATGAPEKGLNVVISSAVGRFRDRTVTTDNDGRFTAVLPEGDWTVRVPVAGASSADSVWPITVAGGLITDDQDREIATLTINR